MGKIAPVAAKYIIHASIKTEGVVEKPDVIGAIFGQTEGLLGEELELRELQKSGKIGRIEVNIDVSGGKASGEIILPSSLDKTETAIVAAAIETIQRIGPCDATIKVTSIEDVRTMKRDYVMGRAKELLKEMPITPSQEFTRTVHDSVRTMDIISFGPDNLTAGKSMPESKEVIVVEGRADVINLLKNGVNNVISMNGTNIPKTIIDLSREKELTLFVDGDRGGTLIEKGLLQVADVRYVARAPRGKEVEELTMKEIHQCLRARKPTKGPARGRTGRDDTEENRREPVREQRRGPRRGPIRGPMRGPVRETRERRETVDSDLAKQFRRMLDELVGTHGVYLLDERMGILGKVPLKELETTLRNVEDVFAVVFDGMITREEIIIAETFGVQYLVGASGSGSSRKVVVLSSSDL